MCIVLRIHTHRLVKQEVDVRIYGCSEITGVELMMPVMEALLTFVSPAEVCHKVFPVWSGLLLSSRKLPTTRRVVSVCCQWILCG